TEPHLWAAPEPELRSDLHDDLEALMCHWLAHSSRVPSRPEGSVMAGALSGLHRGICPIPCARATGRKGGENAFDMAQADREQLIMDQMRRKLRA
ncbi:unnamed protein product, partial [Polarella glacialis]